MAGSITMDNDTDKTTRFSPLRAFGVAYASVVIPRLLTLSLALYRKGIGGRRRFNSVSHRRLSLRFATICPT